jgi:hypothetical protein
MKHPVLIRRAAASFLRSGSTVTFLILLVICMCSTACSKNESTANDRSDQSATPTSSPSQPAPSAAANTSYQIGTVIRFDGTGGSERFRGAGWSQTETDKTWTEGTAATLNFTGLPAGSAMSLKATLIGLTNPPDLAAQPAEVYANGQRIGDWLVNDKKQYVASIPASVIGADGKLDIQFRLPKATSPKALGQSSDPRILGLCFFDLVIDKGT